MEYQFYAEKNSIVTYHLNCLSIVLLHEISLAISNCVNTLINSYLELLLDSEISQKTHATLLMQSSLHQVML